MILNEFIKSEVLEWVLLNAKHGFLPNCWSRAGVAGKTLAQVLWSNHSGCTIGLAIFCSRLVTFGAAHPFSKQLGSSPPLGVLENWAVWLSTAFIKTLYESCVNRQSGRCQRGVGGQKPSPSRRLFESPPPPIPESPPSGLTPKSPGHLRPVIIKSVGRIFEISDSNLIRGKRGKCGRSLSPPEKTRVWADSKTRKTRTQKRGKCGKCGWLGFDVTGFRWPPKSQRLRSFGVS